MNHYPHHIGDFNSATRHLTRVERSLYRDLIDLYYDTEKPLMADFGKLARRIVCDESDVPALREVLNEFFVLEDDGYHNERCDAEIAKYHGLLERASRAGKASAQQRANGKATPVERPLDSGTTNQEPRTKNHISPKTTSLKIVHAERPPDIPERLWGDYLSIRKAKNAPLSVTALSGVRREAVKAGISLQAALTECCERGWSGFRADWYAREHPRPGAGHVAAKFDPVAFVNSGANSEHSSGEKAVDGERVD